MTSVSMTLALSSAFQSRPECHLDFIMSGTLGKLESCSVSAVNIVLQAGIRSSGADFNFHPLMFFSVLLR